MKNHLLKIDPALVLITLVGAVLRLFRPGLMSVQFDEINVLFWANRIVESGNWIWVSNNRISWGSNFTPFANHSPLTNYFVLLPTALSDDPSISRAFIALFGTVSVVLLFVIAKRHFGRSAAIVAGLAYAVSPLAVEWSRLAWNPSIAPVFVVGWIGATLYGYVDGVRPLRWLSWVLLILMIQAHPANALFVGCSILALAGAGAASRFRDRRVLLDTVIGGCLAFLTLLPWLYGTFVEAGAGVQPVASINSSALPVVERSIAGLFEQFGRLTVALSYRTIQRGSPTLSDGNWWPPQSIDFALMVTALLLILAVCGVFVIGLLRFRAQWRLAFVASTAVLPLLIANVISRTEIQDFYLYAILPGAFLCAGIALGHIVLRWPRSRVPLWVVTGIVIAVQAWFSVSMLRNFDLDGWEQRLRASVDTVRSLATAWTEPTNDALVVADTVDEKYTAWEDQLYFWSVMGDGLPLRVVDRRFAPEGIPIAPEGTTLVSLADGTTIEALFGPTVGDGASEDGFDPVFERRVVLASDLPRPDFVPEGPATFASGAQIEGAVVQPEADGVLWSGLLRWSPTRDHPDQQMQFSLRVVDADGRSYGQQDFTSLRPEMWRTGDQVVNPFQVTLNPDAQGRDDLRLQLLMYSLPDVRNAAVLDAQGNPAGEWVILVPEGG